MGADVSRNAAVNAALDEAIGLLRMAYADADLEGPREQLYRDLLGELDADALRRAVHEVIREPYERLPPPGMFRSRTTGESASGTTANVGKPQPLEFAPDGPKRAVDLVRRWYAAAGESLAGTRSAEDLFDSFFTPDAVLEVPTQGLYLCGREEILDWSRRSLLEARAMKATLTPRWIQSDERGEVCVARTAMASRRGWKQVGVEGTSVLRVRDGRISHQHEAVDEVSERLHPAAAAGGWIVGVAAAMVAMDALDVGWGAEETVAAPAVDLTGGTFWVESVVVTESWYIWSA